MRALAILLILMVAVRAQAFEVTHKVVVHDAPDEPHFGLLDRYSETQGPMGPVEHIYVWAEAFAGQNKVAGTSGGPSYVPITIGPQIVNGVAPIFGRARVHPGWGLTVVWWPPANGGDGEIYYVSSGVDSEQVTQSGDIWYSLDDVTLHKVGEHHIKTGEATWDEDALAKARKEEQEFYKAHPKARRSVFDEEKQRWRLETDEELAKRLEE